MNHHLPSWDHLAMFLEVMQGGSLSAGARALNVAQPTARRQIEELEQTLGTPLFTRSRSGLKPTIAAEELLPYAEAMAAAAAAGARTASGAGTDEGGTVRVTCSEIVGAEVLPTIISTFQTANPGIAIELVATNLTEDLLRRDADIAIRMARPKQSALLAKRLASVEVGLYATGACLEQAGPITTLRDFEAFPRLIGDDRSTTLIDAFAARGLLLGREHFKFRADGDLIKLAALRAGLGIGICQKQIASKDSTLVRVFPELSMSLEAWVVMHEDLKRVTRFRKVFDHLSSAIKSYYNN
ncbi:MAG: LysR family transcriptional regulator [Rhodocyclaceae bacterium]|nr:LysR family transcriptional regulator [Rhodocyclaceae bacterium]